MPSKSQMITVELTEPQFQALAAAVRNLQSVYELDGPGSLGHSSQAPSILERAWDKIATGWQRAVDGF